MLSIFIDPYEKTITEVEMPSGPDGWKAIGPKLQCRMFSCCYPADFDDTLYIDDEGLLNHNRTGFFAFKGVPQPLVGRCLTIGSTECGDSTNCKQTLADVKSRVRWMIYPEVLEFAKGI